MPRRRRFDCPGLIHHVVNRGIARRTVFEYPADVRYFLLLLALEVRAGRIEVLAYTIMTTHFHLLLRSRTGELGRVMQRVTNRYVRYFNRKRKRDGPLFRGRYQERKVDTDLYRFNCVRYIDQNASKARMSAAQTCSSRRSATHYVSRRRPPWLDTRYVDGVMGNPPPDRRREVYAKAFGSVLTADEAQIIERRLEHPGGRDDWDDLAGATPPSVLAWMRSKARLADGTKPGMPYVTARTVLQRVDEERSRHGDLVARTSGKRRRDAWPVLRIGLLRDLAGLTYAEIRRHMGGTTGAARQRVEQHARLLEDDATYARISSKIATACLA